MKNSGIKINTLCKQLTEILKNIYPYSNPYVSITHMTTMYDSKEESDCTCNEIGYQLLGHYGVHNEYEDVSVFDLSFRFIIPYGYCNEEFIEGMFYQYVATNESVRRFKDIILDEDSLDEGDYDDEDTKLVC